VFVDFPTKTAFRKAMRLKNPKMAGNTVTITPARKAADKSGPQAETSSDRCKLALHPLALSLTHTHTN
jgi:hypothetical protein